MCRGSANSDASALYVGQQRIMRGGSLSHMSLNAHKRPAAEQFKRLVRMSVMKMLQMCLSQYC